MSDAPLVPTTHESATQEALARGMAFIVDGKHVSADRIFILSVPDTIGPISDMRRAKEEAQALLDEQIEYRELQVQLIQRNSELLESELGRESLRVALIEARADTRRLDWLNKQRYLDVRGSTWSVTYNCANVRLALDANGALDT